MSSLVKIALLVLSISLVLAGDPISITVTQEAGLQLGAVVSGSGQKVIEAGNSPSSDGARFRVQGEPRSSFNFILPQEAVLVHEKNASNTIVLRNFTSNPSLRSGFLNDQGIQYIYVGATAHISSHVLPGSYKGVISLEVFYD